MDDRIYDEPSEVTAKDGVVEVEGPDHVKVRLSPDAALDTSHRLYDAAAHARGQLTLIELSKRKLR
jgi:hypothetical protein